MAVTLDRIEAILTSKYSIQNYVQLVQEIFDSLSLVAPDKFRKEFTNFSSHIVGSVHVGNYADPDEKKMIVAAVELKKATYVESSRSTQRSYAKKLIENAGADAALIAFYTEGDQKWRLSYVRLDYEMKFEKGKLKMAEDMTPAKRYSFLVGEDEPCHTAIDRFRRLLDDKNFHPTLDELEETFSVEAVTNQFFQLYCEKFKQLLIHLEDNPDFVIEAQLHNFTAAQFAKKLMGQIVFLYFLQKKGWLGVKAWPDTLNEKEYKNAFYARGGKSRELIPIVYKKAADDLYRISPSGLDSISDEDEEVLAQCVKGNPWGSGPHNFMRKLFEVAEKKGSNFFEDYLEPLFYDALNVNRGEQGYDPALHCRIPFLSGGLFEPIDGYDWKHNNFAIPNEVFSDRQNNNPRTGNGILDVFDRYNFTMSEDEPMEREVAIDPEMLGKVFENLLEVNDRRAKGAFYTPREIVHYMCQESLINYLTTTLNISEEAVRDFILYGDYMKDEDTVKEKRQGNGGMIISEELYALDSEGHVVTNRLLDMDKALADVRVADPAVGSGAFPLGMLNEIVRARQNISAYFAITMKPYDIRMMYSLERSPHTLKYETIKNCIYAADIEPSAVDIAQLRLWLALVIDDEINPDAQSPLEGHRNPLSLPNLECNILCGNSLIDEFEGIPLINQSDIIGTAHDNQQIDMYQSGFESVLPKLIDAQDRLFRCDDTQKKQNILEEIASYRDMIIMSQLQGKMDADTMERYEESKKAASKPYVLWQLDFARVFRDKGGFDIVMGNPPYIQLQKSINDETGEKLGDQYAGLGFESFAKTGDIYCLFYEKGWQLLREHGVLAFITSNKWMRAGYGEKLRRFLTRSANPLYLIDFGGQQVFESATVDVNILIFTKSENLGRTVACKASENCRGNLSKFVQGNGTVTRFNGNGGWTILSSIEENIKRKIVSKGTPLKDWGVQINYGIKTGYNDAFIIDGKTKDALIAADPNSAELIRPILRGRDIKRYMHTFADLWLINTHNGIREDSIPPVDVSNYPAIKQHLDQYYSKISNRADKGSTPYNLRNCAYMDDFSRTKIIYPETTQGAYFYLDNGDFYADKTCFIMISETPEYLVATLSSALFEFAYKKFFSSIELGQSAYQYNKQAFIFLPIISIDDITSTTYNEIIGMVRALFKSNNECERNDIMSKIDYQIFNLYDINPQERIYIMEHIRHY